MTTQSELLAVIDAGLSTLGLTVIEPWEVSSIHGGEGEPVIFGLKFQVGPANFVRPELRPNNGLTDTAKATDGFGIVETQPEQP